MTEVLIAGVAVADIVMQVAQLPRRAEKYRATDAVITVGGCAANAAVAVARHGGTARLAARLGRDPMGDLIAAALEGEGVDLSLSDRREGARSSFSSIYVDAAGERQIMNYRGAGLAETLDLSTVPRPDAVLADNRWPALTQAALAAARRWGVPGIVDAEAPFEGDALRGATHIAFSMQGLSAYAPGLSAVNALARARAEYGAWVAVTDGANGVWYSGDAGIGHVPAFAVAVVDTLGAGDIWHGAFTLRIAEGAEEADAICFANAAAALKCRAFGGAAACPDRKATEEFLKEVAP
ncbi:MAG: sugar kinase [Rhodobacteraceae bacterium]|nr:sugar kinase [Paracoccaceae bacterium]MCP5353792.1 sugar kinase [Paracoccaceae bacterium]